MSDEYKFHMVAMCLSDEGWFTMTALKSVYTTTITCAKKSHPDQPNDLYDRDLVRSTRKMYIVHRVMRKECDGRSDSTHMMPKVNN
jgi:hypothetical protein